MDCFHSRGKWACFSTKTKENVCTRIEFNSWRINWRNPQGHRSLVWGHQHGRRDVTWKHSILHIFHFECAINAHYKFNKNKIYHIIYRRLKKLRTEGNNFFHLKAKDWIHFALISMEGQRSSIETSHHQVVSIATVRTTTVTFICITMQHCKSVESMIIKVI